jgi:hypothetical protein
MSFTLRGRTVAFDNPSVGNASGRERTTGFTPTTELVGGGTGTGSTDSIYSNPKAGSKYNTTDPAENYVVAGTATFPIEDVVSTS